MYARSRIKPDAPQHSAKNDLVVGLLVGPLQVLVIASMIHQSGETPFWLALILSIGGSAGVMVSVLMLSYRFFVYNETWRRFRLSTILLLMIPISLYLAVIRMVVTAIPINLELWLIGGPFAAIMIYLSLAIYLAMANSLVMLANFVVAFVRWVKKRS